MVSYVNKIINYQQKSLWEANGNWTLDFVLYLIKCVLCYAFHYILRCGFNCLYM